MVYRAVIVTLLGFVAVLAEAADDELRYAFVFDSAISMEKKPQLMLFDAPDGSEIYIDSCGFARLTYRTGPLSATLENYPAEFREQSFLYVMGHWCEVLPALFEASRRNWHLIAYSKRQDGTNVMHYHAEVHWDAAGVPYVADSEFLELTGLRSLERSTAPGSAGAAKGVYLADIATHEEAR